MRANFSCAIHVQEARGRGRGRAPCVKGGRAHLDETVRGYGAPKLQCGKEERKAELRVRTPRKGRLSKPPHLDSVVRVVPRECNELADAPARRCTHSVPAE